MQEKLARNVQKRPYKAKANFPFFPFLMAKPFRSHAKLSPCRQTKHVVIAEALWKIEKAKILAKKAFKR